MHYALHIVSHKSIKKTQFIDTKIDYSFTDDNNWCQQTGKNERNLEDQSVSIMYVLLYRNNLDDGCGSNTM